jgi:hypothetical protein
VYLRLCDGLVREAAPDIRDAVRGMLEACDIVGPPTPLHDLLRFRNLSTEERDGLNARALIPHSLRRKFARLRGRVRGILDLRASHVYVDQSLHHHKKTFLYHHEIAHSVLPWHRELFIVTPEWHLAPDVRYRFEGEANLFAALAIFQLDDLAKWQRGRKLRLSELAALAARYNASLTATARQYVAVQDLPAALLVGKGGMSSDGRPFIRLLYGLANASYLHEFRAELFGAGFGPGHIVTAVLHDATIQVAEHQVEERDLRDDPRQLNCETISNTYATLTLVHPAKRGSRLSRFFHVSRARATARSV